MTNTIILNAQTDDEVSNAVIIGTGALKIGLDLYEAGNRKDSERQLSRWKESGDPRGDCYYIDSNGKLTQDMIDCYVGDNKIRTTCTDCLERPKKAQAQLEKKQKIEQEIQQYSVDLGLPSRTLWMSHNIYGSKRYTYKQAINEFRNNLPTKEQFEELKNYCSWTWDGWGYKIIGPNGNSIFLDAYQEPAVTQNGRVIQYTIIGEYLSKTSCTSYENQCVYNLWFSQRYDYKVYLTDTRSNDNYTFYVRLVSN